MPESVLMSRGHKYWLSCFSASCLVSLSHQSSVQLNVFSGNECDACCVSGEGGGGLRGSSEGVFVCHT